MVSNISEDTPTQLTDQDRVFGFESGIHHLMLRKRNHVVCVTRGMQIRTHYHWIARHWIQRIQIYYIFTTWYNFIHFTVQAYLKGIRLKLICNMINRNKLLFSQNHVLGIKYKIIFAFAKVRLCSHSFDRDACVNSDLSHTIKSMTALEKDSRYKN